MKKDKINFIKINIFPDGGYLDLEYMEKMYDQLSNQT